MKAHVKHLLLYTSLVLLAAPSHRPFALLAAAPTFEGRIQALLTRGGQKQTVLYTAGARQVRIELGETNHPHARNIVDRQTGAVTLLFPHNHSFVRLTRVAAVPPPESPETPLLSGRGAHGVGYSSPPARSSLPGPSVTPAGIGAANLPEAPSVPPMPQPLSALPQDFGTQPRAAEILAGLPPIPATVPIPMTPAQNLELRPTGQTTNLLGFSCQHLLLTQHGEVMEIWATDQLLPFEPYLPNQPPRFGPKLLEDQWPELIHARQLFPLLAILRLEHGSERLRFEVKAVAPEKIADPAGRLFQPPPDYQQIEPLPFKPEKPNPE